MAGTEYNRIYTPSYITRLAPKEIFVFGSDEVGCHEGDAAKVARIYFGARNGIAEGLCGKSYGIPTMVNYRKKFDNPDSVKPYVKRFIECAKSRPDLTFYVTKIGCGIAGYDEAYIAKLFRDTLSLPNVILPKQFVEGLISDNNSE